MKHQLLFNQSETTKLYYCLLIYCQVVNELFNNYEDINKTSIENQKLIKNYIETCYIREWEGVNNGDFSELIKSNILDNK